MSEATQPAMLLLGPTGSGKTPLGDLLEQRGWHGRSCCHFDFGENLRQLVTDNRPSQQVSAAELSFLKEVLATGRLLEDEDFPIAQKVLASFLCHRAIRPETIVVMNGLPRHRGQAQALARDTSSPEQSAVNHSAGQIPALDVFLVISLQGDPEVILQRIAANTGGDRSERTDDDQRSVNRKLQIYSERTQPLIDFYRLQGAIILEVDVTVATTPEQMWIKLMRENVGQIGARKLDNRKGCE